MTVTHWLGIGTGSIDRNNRKEIYLGYKGLQKGHDFFHTSSRYIKAVPTKKLGWKEN